MAKDKISSFNWREHLDEVNELLDRWNEIAENPDGGWSLPKEILWIEGAIYGLTGKEVSVECMDDICRALDIPFHRRDDGMVEWGDAIGVGKDVFVEEVIKGG